MLRVFVLLCLFLGAAWGQAEFTSVSGGRKIAMGILEFKGAEQLSQPFKVPLEKIVMEDLNISGEFTAMYSSMIDSAKWNELEVISFITGELKNMDNGNVLVICNLHDYYNLDILKTYSYEFSAKTFRKVAHNISNEIFKYYSGKNSFTLSKLAYAQKSTKGKNLIIADYDGKNPIKITNSSINTMPEWGIDNKHLYYVSYKKKRPRIYKRELKTGKDEDVLPEVFQSFSPSLSHEGKYLLFSSLESGNADVFSYDLSSSKINQLTTSFPLEASADWSPDGKRVVYSSDRGGVPHLYIMDHDGGNVKRITFETRYNDMPQWSPNGEKIVFCGMTEDKKFNIFLYDVKEETFEQLTAGAGNNEAPSWSPDGRLIVFSSTRNGKSQIFIMNLNTKNIKQITTEGANTYPRWSNISER